MTEEQSPTSADVFGEHRAEPANDSGPGATSAGGNEESSSGPVSNLRGADVQVDARKVGYIALAVALATLLVLAVIFTLAGVRKNQQIQELRSQAIPINATVTSCTGLLGGSGSNFVGYSCSGAYVVDGRRYVELLPGTNPHARGATVRILMVPSDPALISTSQIVATERASWRIFILPAILFLVAIGAAALFVALLRARGKKGEGSAETPR